MTSYCSSSGNAKILVKFADGSVESVISNSPPVNIVTNDDQTLITYASNWLHGPNHPQQYDLVDGIVTWDGNCNPRGDGTYVAVLSNGFMPVYSNSNCAMSLQVTPCSITVTDTGGLNYQKTGKCPITFTVNCNDNCPDGYIKCQTTNYPGYCCLPCAPIESQINQLIQQVKRLQND